MRLTGQTEDLDEVAAMINLVNRANGELLLELSQAEFDILQDQLVRESDEDFDYYVQEASLQLLADAGMPETVTEGLSRHMHGRGLDLGWEHAQPGPGLTYTGSIVDDEVQALGGIRVDVVSKQTANILAWTFSRLDGTFSVTADGKPAEVLLQMSGRGDLILREFDMKQDGEVGQFEIQTLTGTLLNEALEPVAGVSVQLEEWSAAESGHSVNWKDLGGRRTWGDSDENGRFSIPVNLPEDRGVVSVELDLVDVNGRTLVKFGLALLPESSFEMGDLTVPDQLEEGTVPILAEPPVVGSISMYPGVSENPLS